jgi:fatty-acyl-CoA synthase
MYTMSVKPLVPSFWENATATHLIAHAAERYEDDTALSHRGTEISFRELRNRILDCASGLREAGVESDDRVAILAEDHPEWFYAVFGTAMLGAHPVFLPIHYTPREIHHAITLTGVETLIAQDRTDEGNILERYGPLFFEGRSTPDDSVVIEDTVTDQLERIYTLDPVAKYEETVTLESLIETGKSTDVPPNIIEAVDPEDTAAVLFTSGTTSMPKAVIRTHRNVLPHAVDMGNWYGRSPADHLLDLFPNPSITAMNQLLMALAHGCTYHLADHYDVDRAVSILANQPITCLAGVDTMFRDLLDHPDLAEIDVSAIDRIFLALTGGVDPDLARDVEHTFGAPMENPYGMSETNAFTLRSKPEHPFEARIQPGGKPGYKTGVIVDPGTDTSNTAGTVDTEINQDPDHLVGEFCVKGITVTPGYDVNESANEEAFDDQEWFHTDDTGSLQIVDGEYFFYFSGRLDDMFQVGGNNVSPSEIETVIADMSEVSWAGVIGVPHDRLGSVPAAFVTLDDETTEPTEVTTYCEARLASYKVPRTVFIIEPSEIPTEEGVNGKKLRRDRLRNRATKERTIEEE